MAQNRIGSSTLLLKMTPGSSSEAAALARGRRVRMLDRPSRPGPAPVLVIRDSAHEDQIDEGGGPLDLTTASGRRCFVDSLPLGEERRSALASVLAGASPGSRDELARLARVLSCAEAGRLRLERVVLSGHFHARGMRGELAGPARNGTLDFGDLRRLLELFPAAVRQVRHLMLAICFRGGTGAPAALDGRAGPLQSYRELFPNLSTLAGYRGRAHLSGHGAEADLRRWASATARADARFTRAQIFGPCPARPPGPGPTQRRAGGVVHSEAGEDRCRWSVSSESARRR